MVRRYDVLMAAVVAAVVAPAWGAPVSDMALSAVEAARSYGAAVRSGDMGWALDYMYPPLKKLYAEQYVNRSTGNEIENARRIMGITRESREQAQARTRSALKALRDHYVRIGKERTSKGIKIESFTVQQPVAEYVLTTPSAIVNEAAGSANRSRLVVLPTTAVFSGPSRNGQGSVRVERRAHIYAIRDEVVNGPLDRNGFTLHDTKINKWYFADSNTDINTLRAFFPNLPLRLTLPDGGERIVR